MSAREVAIANTESFFRHVNERIEEGAERLDTHDAEFICECADPKCTARVHATIDEYEQVRATPTRFLLAPGHEDTSVERVVRESPRHAVVEKFNERVAAAVRRFDPRTQTA